MIVVTTCIEYCYRRSSFAIGKSRKLIVEFASFAAALPAKQRVNIYLDSAIVEHFKAEAGERGYKTLINEALRNAIKAKTIEKTIRHVIRQELEVYKI